jgi:hypothetical protein
VVTRGPASGATFVAADASGVSEASDASTAASATGGSITSALAAPAASTEVPVSGAEWVALDAHAGAARPAIAAAMNLARRARIIFLASSFGAMRASSMVSESRAWPPSVSR